jgi:hypothetical protein
MHIALHGRQTNPHIEVMAYGVSRCSTPGIHRHQSAKQGLSRTGIRQGIIALIKILQRTKNRPKLPHPLQPKTPPTPSAMPPCPPHPPPNAPQNTIQKSTKYQKKKKTKLRQENQQPTANKKQQKLFFPPFQAPLTRWTGGKEDPSFLHDPPSNNSFTSIFLPRSTMSRGLTAP